MSSDALYHEALVRLAREAAGAGRLDAPDGSASRDNPLCGDQVTFEVRWREGTVAALAQRVRGCILCQAAASLLGRAALGATLREVGAAQAQLDAMLGGGAPPPPGRWGELAAFAPVRNVPSRHGCVQLPLQALAEAMAQAAAAAEGASPEPAARSAPSPLPPRAGPPAPASSGGEGAIPQREGEGDRGSDGRGDTGIRR